MVKKPKRRKNKDNPYDIDILDDGYQVSFKDSKGILQKVSIDSQIYELFNKFELEDISEMHEYERHIEHSEIFDYTLEKRAINKQKSVEDFICEKIQYEELNKEINLLPKIQKNRIKKYFLEGKTYDEIAKEEYCSKVAVKYSIDIAIKKISEKMKK